MEAMVAAGVVELADADEATVQRWLAERGRELAKGEAAAAVAEVEEGWGGGGLRSGRHVNNCASGVVVVAASAVGGVGTA